MAIMNAKKIVDKLIGESSVNESRENDNNRIFQAAQEGLRVIVDSKTVWAGLGNRSGLHSYAQEVLSNNWSKSGSNFMRKIQALPDGTEVRLQYFRNINRDRGKWVHSGTITLGQEMIGNSFIN